MSDTGRCPHCEAYIGNAALNAHARLCELNPENNVPVVAHDLAASARNECMCLTCVMQRTVYID